MAFKPVGVDENGNFPPRVEEALSATIDTQIEGSDYLPATFVSGRDSNRPMRNFMRRLRTGISPNAFMVQGDSTGNETVEWVYMTAAWLAARFPAFTVKHRGWNQTTQGYDDPTVIQIGTAGLRRFTDAGSGAGTGRVFTIPDTTATSITGDIDVRARVNLNGGNFTSRGSLGGKYGGGGQVGWRVGIDPDNTMLFTWSANGTSATTFNSTVALDSTQLNSDIWLRYTLDVDNGASGHDAKFYTSTDGVTWAQVGTTRTGAGVTSNFDNNASTQFVGFGGSVFANVGHTVDFLNFRVFPGLSGVAPVVDIDFGSYDGYNTSFVDACGNAVQAGAGTTGTFSGAFNLDVFNGSAPGEAITYSSDATRFAKQAVGTPRLAFVSYGHNDITAESVYRTAYKLLTDQLLAKWPDIGVVCVLQNPQKSPRTPGQIALHAFRQAVICDLAAQQNLATVDVFGEMLSAEPSLATMVKTDGVHPSIETGSPLWFGLVRRQLEAADES